MVNGSLDGAVKVLGPRKSVNFLADLEITSDSVVVKVRMVTNNSTRRIAIDWGDLKSDVLSFLPGTNLELSPVADNADPLPDGTYEIFHAYEAPEEKVAFDRHITLRIQDNSRNIDQRSTTVTLNPKYTVNVYQTSVNLLDAADIGNGAANFEITQNVDGVQTGRWSWAPSNNFFSEGLYHRLPGSQFRRIYELGGETIFFTLDFLEKDGFLNSDDKGRLYGFITAYTPVGQMQKTIDVSDPIWGSCRVRIRYYIEMEVYRPLPSSGGLLTFATN